MQAVTPKAGTATKRWAEGDSSDDEDMLASPTAIRHPVASDLMLESTPLPILPIVQAHGAQDETPKSDRPTVPSKSKPTGATKQESMSATGKDRSKPQRQQPAASMSVSPGKHGRKSAQNGQRRIYWGEDKADRRVDPADEGSRTATDHSPSNSKRAIRNSKPSPSNHTRKQDFSGLDRERPHGKPYHRTNEVGGAVGEEKLQSQRGGIETNGGPPRKETKRAPRKDKSPTVPASESTADTATSTNSKKPEAILGENEQTGTSDKNNAAIIVEGGLVLEELDLSDQNETPMQQSNQRRRNRNSGHDRFKPKR